MGVDRSQALGPLGRTDVLRILGSARQLCGGMTRREMLRVGGLGTDPSPALLDLLSDVDVVIIPIGMPDTLSPADAAKAIRTVEPTITIPVGYDPDGDGEALKAFVAGMAVEPEPPISRFTVSRRVAGEERRLVLLEARA